MTGLVIGFEGLDYSGKDTQLGRTMTFLNSKGVRFETGREPGSTSYGEAMRRYLQDPFYIKRLNNGYADVPQTRPLSEEEGLNPYAEMFGYMTARAQFFPQIKKGIEKGELWLLSRSGDTTIAYQGFGHFSGEPKILEFILRANSIAMQGVKINRTYFVDITAEEMLKRSASNEFGSGKDRIEQRAVDYFNRCRDGYLWLASKFPERIMVIDGTLIKDDVESEIRKDLIGILREHKFLK